MWSDLRVRLTWWQGTGPALRRGTLLSRGGAADLGLTPEFRSTERFEVVGADAAAAFLKDEGVAAERREIVWDAIALHTSIGIASRKRPEIALDHVGAGVDVLGMGIDRFPSRLAVETMMPLPRPLLKTAFF